MTREGSVDQMVQQSWLESDFPYLRHYVSEEKARAAYFRLRKNARCDSSIGYTLSLRKHAVGCGMDSDTRIFGGANSNGRTCVLRTEFLNRLVHRAVKNARASL